MKKVLLSFLMFAATMTLSVAGVIVITGDAVTGEINTNMTLTKDNQYLLKGFVYVTAGHTITIEAGTVIKGDQNTKGTLIIEPGAWIIAKGTKDSPIVFTSAKDAGTRNYGDWGGVVICGNAPDNSSVGTTHPQVEGGPRTHYGGTNADDSSGVFQYVRIEYAGIALSANNEINGLTLCAVGRKTVIDHVMVSFSGDDSFEFFGGTVNAKYLIANRGWDDDFDTDLGFSGNVQFAIGWRDPYAADQSGSKGFESDNDAAASSKTPMTSCVFSNVTLVGPVQNTASFAYADNYVAGVQIRRNSSLSLFNSVIDGWPTGILIDGPKTADNIAGDSLFIQNVIIAGIQKTSGGSPKEIVYLNPAGPGTQNSSAGNTMASDSSAFGTKVGPITWLLNGGNSNKKYTQPSDMRFTNAYGNNYTGTPSFVPTSTSPVVWNGSASTPAVAPAFTNNKLSNSFFTPTTFVGAIGGTDSDWTTDGAWVNWNPQGLVYSLATGVANALESMPMSVYPNPTIGLTTLKFDLNSAGSALSISIVDMNGRTVSTLPASDFATGSNEVSFDATNLTPGIYLVKISSDNGVKSVRFSVN